MTLHEFKISFAKILTVLLPILWLAVTPTNAYAWSITSVSPNPVKVGCAVKLTGSFGPRGNNTVRYGSGGGRGAAMPITSWSSTAIKADTRTLAPNGRYWIGIYSWNGARLARASKTLYLQDGPCTGSSRGMSISKGLGVGPSIKSPAKVKPSKAFKSGVTPPSKVKPAVALAPGKKIKSDVALKSGIKPPPQIKPTVALKSGIKPPSQIKPDVGFNLATQPPKTLSDIGFKQDIKGPARIKSSTAIEYAVTPRIHKVQNSDKSGGWIKPGVEVRIKGENFGKETGKVLFRVPGYVDVPIKLGNVGWVSDTEILASIPHKPQRDRLASKDGDSPPSNLQRDIPVAAKGEYRVVTSGGRNSGWFTPGLRVSTKAAINFAITPRITRVTGAAGIGPGKKFVIEGETFGDQPGSVFVRTDLHPSSIFVDNIVWESSSRITGTLWKGLISEKELSFKVTRPGGKSSAWYTTAFDPTVEILLPGTDFSASCEGGTDYDDCNDRLSYDKTLLPWKLNNQTIRGYHRQNSLRVGQDYGTDTYLFHLYNGWVVSRFKSISTKRSTGDYVNSGSVLVEPVYWGLKKGGTNLGLRIVWGVHPGSFIMYEYKVWIKGPKGVPYDIRLSPAQCKSQRLPC